MSAWPGSLPQRVLIDGYSEELAKNSLRSQVDQGAAKTRQRYTSAIRMFQINLLLTETQTATFETFYNSTIAYGASSFTWVHPRTNAAATCRITDQPKISARGVNYNVSFGMEILP